MKFPEVGRIFLFLGIILVLSYISFSIFSFSQKEQEVLCKEVKIRFLDESEMRLVTESEVAKMLDQAKENPIGCQMGNVETERIEQLLMKCPMIKSVQCFKTLSGRLYIDIQQRTPCYLLAGMMNYYVDTDRKLMPVSINYAAYVPVVSGFVSVNFAKGDLFDFIEYLTNNEFWNAQVEQVYVNQDKSIELIPRVGDTVIKLGKLHRYKEKLASLFQLYQQVFNVIGWNRYQSISVQYDGQIVCKRREDGANPIAPLRIENDTTTIVKVL